MATVVGGVGYGLYFIAKVYIGFPTIVVFYSASLTSFILTSAILPLLSHLLLLHNWSRIRRTLMKNSLEPLP